MTLFFKASPTYVNASSAPCSESFFEIPHAIDLSLATPMIKPFLPFRSMAILSQKLK